MSSKEHLKNKTPKKLLWYFLLILFVGAVLMTGSMIASGKNKQETLLEVEKTIVPPSDYRYISRTIDQNCTLSFSYIGNATIDVYLLPNNSYQDLNYSLDVAQKNIDSYKLTTNEITKIPVEEAGYFTIAFVNSNMTSSALISSITCEAQWTGTFDVPTQSSTLSIFYVGIALSLLGTLLFVADQFSLQEKLIRSPGGTKKKASN